MIIRLSLSNTDSIQYPNAPATIEYNGNLDELSVKEAFAQQLEVGIGFFDKYIFDSMSNTLRLEGHFA